MLLLFEKKKGTFGTKDSECTQNTESSARKRDNSGRVAYGELGENPCASSGECSQVVKGKMVTSANKEKVDPISIKMKACVSGNVEKKGATRRGGNNGRKSRRGCPGSVSQ